MRNNTSIIYNLILLVGDGVAVVFGLSLAYILRVSISHQALTAHVYAINYLKFLFLLLPFWLIVFALLGLYQERYYQNRFFEFGRVLIGSFIGILFVISYSYMVNVAIFPARLVVIYGFLFATIAVLIFRNVLREVQKDLFKKGIGVNKVLIIGDSKITSSLIESLSATEITGYKIIGIVGCKNNLIKKSHFKTYSDFESAIKNLSEDQPHTIIQTELYSSSYKNDQILSYAQNNHIAYRFIPGNSELFVGNIKADLFHSIPIISVHQTALVGWGRVAKRLTDLILGCLFLIISSPIFIIVILIQKISEPKGKIFYTAKRLTIFGNVFKIYKFRTLKSVYNDMSPESGFNKMGRPELIKIYRDNGDFIPNDPRISRLGRFLRRYSIDELPQIINVIKGDISLVGPRALDTFELEQYDKKNQILAVKSGLTGLAQISGRRTISFKERRKLDIYYVQNWSFLGDLIILAKTFWVVLFHKGAD